MSTSRKGTIAAVALVAVAASGCAGGGLGTVGDILGGVLNPGPGGQQSGELVAEVQSVDTRQQAIHVRAQNGQSGAVAFDQNTVVVYRQQQYPVTALERGDVVRMQVQQVNQNVLYTPRVDVEQSVQERTGQTSGGGQLHQMYGSVGEIDRQNGFFQLRTQQGAYTVVMPPNAGYETTERFRQLRSGQNVSIEGVMTGSSRIDLHRFI